MVNRLPSLAGVPNAHEIRLSIQLCAYRVTAMFRASGETMLPRTNDVPLLHEVQERLELLAEEAIASYFAVRDEAPASATDIEGTSDDPDFEAYVRGGNRAGTIELEIMMRLA